MLGKLEKELPAELYYHGVHHTRDVMSVAGKLAEIHGLDERERNLLITATAYHDAGFLVTYRNHEEAGCEMVQQLLPGYGYTSEDIEEIQKLIMATKVPQVANSFLEELICDADLDYLGREDFEEIADTLFREFQLQGIVKTELDWYRLQERFLSSHFFFNEYSREHRTPVKMKHLEQIRQHLQELEQNQS